jgi:hypothetical protein
MGKPRYVKGIDPGSQKTWPYAQPLVGERLIEIEDDLW